MARLYFSAKNLTGLPYICDTLIAYYKEDGKKVKMEFDVQGCTVYSETGIHARMTGSLIPWVFTDLETGKERDFYEEDDYPEYTDEDIWNIVVKADSFTLCLYPQGEPYAGDEELSELCEDEKMWDCEAELTLCVNGEEKIKHFSFTPEIPAFEVFPYIDKDSSLFTKGHITKEKESV